MRQEIRNRKKDLTDSIEKVKWEFQDDSCGEFEDEDEDAITVRKFTYDRQSGGTGTYKEY